MTSTPTPEPGERVWRCLLDGSCTATSTDDIGYHVACGWVTLPAPSTPGEGAGRPDTAQLREAATNAEVGGIVDETIITAAADWIDAQPPASPADDVPDADAVAFQNGYRIGVRVGSEHHGHCRGLPPASPVPPTRPEALVSIEATTLTEWADLRDAIAHADRLTPGEVMAADTHPLAPVAAAARAFIAACTTPPTPTPCPYIVSGDEGTSYCSLAETCPAPSAPSVDREAIRSLVWEWSNRAARERNRMLMGSLDAADTYEMCADELADLLAAADRSGR